MAIILLPAFAAGDAGDSGTMREGSVVPNKVAQPSDFGFNGPLAQSPVDVAKAFQGSPKFPGVDTFREITIKKGTTLFAGEPGFSGFFTTASGFRRSGGDATKLFDGLQVPARRNADGITEFRPGVGVFEVTQDVKAAFGIVRANPQVGSGGLPQVVIPNFSNVVEQKFSISLINRVPD